MVTGDRGIDEEDEIVGRASKADSSGHGDRAADVDLGRVEDRGVGFMAAGAGT